MDEENNQSDLNFIKVKDSKEINKLVSFFLKRDDKNKISKHIY